VVGDRRLSAGVAGVLAGLRIVETTAFVAGPLAGLTLAQLGADVIRVDRLEGGLDHRRWPVTADGTSLFWAGLNRGKRSAALDLGRPEGREALRRLITAPGEDAGVYLTNLPARPPLDYAGLRRDRPDLIMLQILGDRHGGPQVDYTVNPAVGFPDATGPEGSAEPVAHVLPAWDCLTGKEAALAILAAERHRRRTGEGQLIELALKDVAVATLGQLGILAEVEIAGVDRPKVGNALYGGYGQDFATADGRRVMVVGLTSRQWQGLINATGAGPALDALVRHLGRDLAQEGERFLARHAITAVLAPWFAARPLAEIAAALTAHGCTWAPFRSFARALAEDPDLSAANPLLASVDDPGIGPHLAPGTPLAFGALPRRPPARAPRLGEHTAAVLRDVGYKEAEIAELTRA
jgi:2-methylfumaryl-CoA isomerase